jgi:hypothetical protein
MYLGLLPSSPADRRKHRYATIQEQVCESNLKLFQVNLQRQPMENPCGLFSNEVQYLQQAELALKSGSFDGRH